MKLTPEAKYEIRSTEDKIKLTAKNIITHAEMVKQEMEQLIAAANQVVDDPGNTRHFLMSSCNGGSWTKLPSEITELDTRARGLVTMKSLLKEMGIEI